MAQRGYGADPFTPRRAFNWSGFYLGLQGGYSVASISAESGPYAAPFDQSYSYNSTGFLGGGHFGYNWQYGHYLFGLETDIDLANIDSHSVGSLGHAQETRIDWQSTLRARLGWISGPWLYYATGGLAFSQASVKHSVPLGFIPFASSGERYVGWTIGAGLERAIADNTTLRLEYRYTDFGSAEFSNAAADTRDRSSIATNSLRLGVSFKF